VLAGLPMVAAPLLLAKFLAGGFSMQSLARGFRLSEIIDWLFKKIIN
jgi:hypothetical protein